MSTPFQTLVPRSSLPRISFQFHPTHLKTPNHLIPIHPHFKTLKTHLLIPSNSHPHHPHRHSPIKSFDSDTTVHKSHIVSADTFDLDDLLSISEFLCLASSAALSIGFVINTTFSNSQKPVLEWLGHRVAVWQTVLLVVGIVIGVVIRRRQWRRICLGFGKSGSSGVGFIARIEKVEEDLRSSATIVRVLSRQLEKLGIRFRVTRKSMKEPIAQTAELAKKNSEATRALAMQEDNLEKELGEIQKVLLAMQDQQQKQLELILAIAKSGKLLDNNPARNQDQKKSQGQSQTTSLAAGVSNSDDQKKSQGQSQTSSVAAGVSNSDGKR